MDHIQKADLVMYFQAMEWYEGRSVLFLLLFDENIMKASSHV